MSLAGPSFICSTTINPNPQALRALHLLALDALSAYQASRAAARSAISDDADDADDAGDAGDALHDEAPSATDHPQRGSTPGRQT